jgi:hypothetical protein
MSLCHEDAIDRGGNPRVTIAKLNQQLIERGRLNLGIFAINDDLHP